MLSDVIVVVAIFVMSSLLCVVMPTRSSVFDADVDTNVDAQVAQPTTVTTTTTANVSLNVSPNKFFDPSQSQSSSVDDNRVMIRPLVTAHRGYIRRPLAAAAASLPVPIVPPLPLPPAGYLQQPYPMYTRVRLGYGSYYFDGTQADLRCNFPYNLNVLSNFVWNKVSDNMVHYLDSYRISERSVGHTTVLHIVDAIAKDLGLYECAVTGSFLGAHPVTFYQEVHFYPVPGAGQSYAANRI